ncbi:hypothetical protein LUTEI9C_60096 [Luteimonas sp. 9C]|nr:hypothetical protein LUTEI9C_60096 [Luteimonas sp. 9C]
MASTSTSTRRWRGSRCLCAQPGSRTTGSAPHRHCVSCSANSAARTPRPLDSMPRAWARRPTISPGCAHRTRSPPGSPTPEPSAGGRYTAPIAQRATPCMTAPLPARDDIRIAVIGLGYVGLPLAVAFGRRHATLGFNIDRTRVDGLQHGEDHTRELSRDELRAAAQLPLQRRRSRARELQRAHRHRAHAGRRLQAARPVGTGSIEPCGRCSLAARRRGDLRVDGLPGRDGRDLRADPRGRIRPSFPRGFPCRLQPRTHQSGRQAAPSGEHAEGHGRLQ